jgi:hypothetical protein
MGEMRNAFKILVGKCEGKRPPRRSGHRGEDNIKMDLKEIGCEGVGQTLLVLEMNKWQIVVSTIMHILVSQKTGISSPAEQLSSSQGLCSME